MALTTESPRQALANLISPKLKKIHFDRLAIVYVRQSSPHQVREHCESTALQYALVDRAIELGFHSSQVIVIDEDQAQSGTSIVGRTGFQRLLAEVSNAPTTTVNGSIGWSGSTTKPKWLGEATRQLIQSIDWSQDNWSVVGKTNFLRKKRCIKSIDDSRQTNQANCWHRNASKYTRYRKTSNRIGER